MNKLIIPIAMTAAVALTASNASAGVLYNLFHPGTWGASRPVSSCNSGGCGPMAARSACQTNAYRPAPLPYQYGQPVYGVGNPYQNGGYMNYPPVNGYGGYGPYGQVAPARTW
ncbi:MAG: hypothetical protein ACK5Q5_13905 [Planctomycetaceae bacterium]